MSDWVLIVILIILFLLAILVLPQFMIARAVPKVIKIFRKGNAVGIKNAKAVEELGLQPKSIVDRMMRLRDYKPRALQLLIQLNIVQMTEDGKVYLSEEMLANTRWRNC
jgi:hypothetical protein